MKQELLYRPRMLKRWNNKGSFQRWSWVGIACHLLVSQSWRPTGSSQLRRVIQCEIIRRRAAELSLLLTNACGQMPSRR